MQARIKHSWGGGLECVPPSVTTNVDALTQRGGTRHMGSERLVEVWGAPPSVTTNVDALTWKGGTRHMEKGLGGWIGAQLTA